MALHRCKGRGVHGASGVSHIFPLLSAEDPRAAEPRCRSDVDSKASPPPKRKRMEAARGAFHAQLAAVMDSLLAAAVCEIAKIFESSLCEQQAELAHKTDEICVLRVELEKAGRRQRAKGGGVEGSEEVEVASGDREGSSRQQTQAGSEGLSQSLSGLKEEVTGQSDASIKHERAVPRASPKFTAGRVPDGGLAAGDLRQTETLSGTQAKAKLSHWDEGGAEHRSLQDQASTPFLSISQSGRCSPGPDPSPAQPAHWLPGLSATRGGVSGLENLQMDGTSCSGPASSSTGTDGSCFRPGFVSDETSNEDDDDGGSFPFLDQEPENHDSNQNAAQGHGGGPRGARQIQPPAPSGESPWRPRDDRGGRGSVNHPRRLAAFGGRDPLRPQPNALRHTNALSHPAAPGGGSGRPYTCPYCTKCFTYPSHQRRHLLRHTGVRLHPCQFCDKSFLTPSELTVHTRTHTGERPFGCAQCGKRFARSGNLRAHQRDVHMGKRPFACGECGKRFAHRGNLRVHNHRVHQGDPYYMEEQQEPDLGPNPI